MSGLATAIVALLSTLLPLISGGSAATIDSIINVLVQLIPEVVQEVETVGPIISNIIATLQSSAAITADQLTALQAVEAQYDAAFNAAALAAGAPAVPAASPAAPADPLAPAAPAAS